MGFCARANAGREFRIACSAALAGETIDQYIDDSTITTEVDGKMPKEPGAYYMNIDADVKSRHLAQSSQSQVVHIRPIGDRVSEKLTRNRVVESIMRLLKIEEKK